RVDGAGPAVRVRLGRGRIVRHDVDEVVSGPALGGRPVASGAGWIGRPGRRGLGEGRGAIGVGARRDTGYTVHRCTSRQGLDGAGDGTSIRRPTLFVRTQRKYKTDPLPLSIRK